MAPGRPQDSFNTTLKRPKSHPRASLTMPGPPRNAYDRSGCSNKNHNEGLRIPGTPSHGLPQRALQGFKRAPCHAL